MAYGVNALPLAAFYSPAFVDDCYGYDWDSGSTRAGPFCRGGDVRGSVLVWLSLLGDVFRSCAVLRDALGGAVGMGACF